VGNLPIAPGTYGAAEGVLLYLALAWLAPPDLKAWVVCVALGLLTVASLWVIRLALPGFASDDPSAIVLDEVVGQALTLVPLAFFQRPPIPWLGLAAGFFLFRVLDTLKPYPIRNLGESHGAWGVLADDLGAAVAGAAILFALLQFGII
jgi:phosphatidylglycerophosphatase A